MPKKSIRETLLARRKHLSAETCLARSLLIQRRLLETAEFQKAAAVALYSPILNEVFTEELFRSAKQRGKLVAYPRVSGGSLEFVVTSAAEELRPGVFNVLEPIGKETIPFEELEMVVVPGVAFDQEGHRLGYGKGFYDRVLHRKGGGRALVGLCFELQLVEALPAEVHDVAMDLLITEERVLRMDQAAPGVKS
jgi:5-formyltetrahydrofolate cyclo-ligase